MPGRDRQVNFVLLLVTLLAFALRVQGLDAQSLWYDEGSSVTLATQGLRQIIFGKIDHPPLYHLLLGGWVRLGGTSEFAARFFSVFCGVLIVVLGASLGTLLLGRRAGALTALFLAVSPIEVWYAQEARMYALLGAFTLASCICLLRLMDGRRGRTLWVLYTLANAAAVYTHYYAALILAVQALWVLLYLLKERDWRLVRNWILAQVGMGMLLLPWVPVQWKNWGAANATYWPGALSWEYILQNTALGFAGAYLTISPEAAEKLVRLGGGLVALGLLAGLVRPRHRWSTILLIVYVVVPFVIFYELVHTRPKFSPRYLLGAVPPLLALMSGGVASVWPRAVRRWHEVPRLGVAAVLAGSLALGSVYVTTNGQRDSTFGRDDMRGAARFLMDAAGPDEAVILLSGHFTPVYTYYYHRDNYYPIPPKLVPVPSVDDPVGPEVLDELNRIIEGRRGVWLLLWQDDVVDPNRLVQTMLETVATEVPVAAQFRGLGLRHYVFPPGTRLRSEMFIRQPLDLNLGEGDIKLAGCGLPTRPVPGGGQATVLLLWQSLRPTPYDYRISLRVLDEYGQLRAHLDQRLAAFMYSTDRWQPGRLVMARHDLPLPPTLPPGRYSLEARIYRYGSEFSEVASLGQFEVERAQRPPTPAELGIAAPLDLSFGDLELLQYQLSQTEAIPGPTVNLTFFWRALARPAQPYRAALFLGGQPWASLPLPASVTAMQPDDIMEVQLPLPVPRDAEKGNQRVELALEDASGQLLAQRAALGELAIQVSDRNFAVPAGIQNLRRFSLGEGITFLGFDLPGGALHPGDSLPLTLYWQATQPMDKSYTVFIHLLDHQEKVWGQVDAIPVQQTRPTSGWLPGEVLIDTYTVPLRSDAPPGQYTIEIGIYDAATWERLAVRTSEGQQCGDRILLDSVLVEATGK